VVMVTSLSPGWVVRTNHHAAIQEVFLISL
jgi:hypothetical protein